MKKTLVMGLLAASVCLANAGVKVIGEVNGVKIVRVKTAGLFAPSSTTICSYPTNQPGTLTVLNYVGGPGLVPAVANAGGIVGAAALLRPDRNTINQQGGGADVETEVANDVDATAVAVSGSTATSGSTSTGNWKPGNGPKPKSPKKPKKNK
jgi:hypothetical protein